MVPVSRRGQAAGHSWPPVVSERRSRRQRAQRGEEEKKGRHGGRRGGGHDVEGYGLKVAWMPAVQCSVTRWSRVRRSIGERSVATAERTAGGRKVEKLVGLAVRCAVDEPVDVGYGVWECESGVLVSRLSDNDSGDTGIAALVSVSPLWKWAGPDSHYVCCPLRPWSVSAVECCGVLLGDHVLGVLTVSRQLKRRLSAVELRHTNCEQAACYPATARQQCAAAWLDYVGHCDAYYNTR